jgi:gas vesicle protein
MVRDDSGAAGTVIVAFVLGAVTGAAVALLMAPAAGEETRRKNTLSSALERGREAYQQARSGGSTAVPKPGETL